MLSVMLIVIVTAIVTVMVTVTVTGIVIVAVKSYAYENRAYNDEVLFTTS